MIADSVTPRLNRGEYIVKDMGWKTKMVRYGISWKANEQSGWFSRLIGRDNQADLDSWCALLGGDGTVIRLISHDPNSLVAGVSHLGDCPDGDGSENPGEDEVMLLDLERLSLSVVSVAFGLSVVSDHDLSEIDDVYACVSDLSTGKWLHHLKADCVSGDDTLVVAKLLRGDEGWSLASVGETYQAGANFSDLIGRHA